MEPIIKASSEIRRNYNDISKLCRATQQPVFLTKNGEGDTVIMDIATFSRRETALEDALSILKARMDRITGTDYLSIDAFEGEMREAIARGAQSVA